MSAHTPGPWKAVSAAACADIDVMEQLLAALKQAVVRQGFTNDELISARALIAQVEGKQ